jgi:hypothetical protein
VINDAHENAFMMQMKCISMLNTRGVTLYNQENEEGSENENSDQENKNTQLSIVQVVMSLKHKLIKCGARLALDA